MLSIMWTHNHGLVTAHALSYRDHGTDLRDQFIQYFNEGLSPSAAMKYHRDSIEMSSDFVEQLLADASKNPLPHIVYRWHDEWRKENLGMVAMLFMIKLMVRYDVFCMDDIFKFTFFRNTLYYYIT